MSIIYLFGFFTLTFAILVSFIAGAISQKKEHRKIINELKREIEFIKSRIK